MLQHEGGFVDFAEFLESAVQRLLLRVQIERFKQLRRGRNLWLDLVREAAVEFRSLARQMAGCTRPVAAAGDKLK